MKNRTVYLGDTEIAGTREDVSGSFLEIGNERYYRISNYQEMPDFLMSIVSDSDHWMYLSSNGSLSAGRKNRDNSLFPYYTDDKIHDYQGMTGSKTIMLISYEGKTRLWEPFSEESKKIYSIQRNLYKSILGNKVIFEEDNHDLGISFSYGWYNSEQFGFVRKSSIRNLGKTRKEVEILDGIRNIMPHGIDYQFQNSLSNLANAYKKNELINGTSLALFTLSSIPVDRAEPSEALKATTVFSLCDESSGKILISDGQLMRFSRGEQVETEYDIRASRGAYYLNTRFGLIPDREHSWYFVADINQDSTRVANLIHNLKSGRNLQAEIMEDIKLGTGKLLRLVAGADGLQCGNEELCTSRHFANSLYNIMRGGVYYDHYSAERRDFINYVKNVNRKVYAAYSDWFEGLAENFSCFELNRLAEESGNPDLERICREYFPLTFSRRHGDPSRPWNVFSIETKHPDGSVNLNYEGNWRDIFQNWEALSLSFPGFIEGMIAKFLNASTADGYNPYRITRNGIDWERPDPEDPWAFIGYWGDHQIIYLLKLLEQLDSFYPDRLEILMGKEIYVYANVPYRIKSFEELEKDPRNTIEFNAELDNELSKNSAETGSDGKLLRNNKGDLCRGNMVEKILGSLLAKFTNFIPEAGIWMNTQRPEWNDANNALVGNGASMVTLYYIRRYIEFLRKKLAGQPGRTLSMSDELGSLFHGIKAIMVKYHSCLESGFSDLARYQMTSELGRAGGSYRDLVYKKSFSGKRVNTGTDEIISFLNLALEFVDQSIKRNKRNDGLYHAYNLVSFGANSISIRHLYEMLEGQVAVLSSGYLNPRESLHILDSLRNSKLYREDQNSYILYPDRQLPRFIEKNNIPAKAVKDSPLLSMLAAAENSSILTVDNNGSFHFNGSFRNGAMLSGALDELDRDTYGTLVNREKEKLIELFDHLFDHESFTGRSGTFYGYEGLGCIYWHMVAKLVLAVEECYFKALETGTDHSLIERLSRYYNEIKAGIGLYKSPDHYGAFPTDAYSHTPGGAGVKQPGLTGQVKEDILSRMAEIGLRVVRGRITFNMALFNREELLDKETVFQAIQIDGSERSIKLAPGEIAYTFCQVPIIYKGSQKERIIVKFSDGKKEKIPGTSLDENLSALVFSRSGTIDSIRFESPYFS